MSILQMIIFFGTVVIGLVLAFCLDARIERRRKEERIRQKKRNSELRAAYVDLLNKQREDYKEALGTVTRSYERIINEGRY